MNRDTLNVWAWILDLSSYVVIAAAGMVCGLTFWERGKLVFAAMAYAIAVIAVIQGLRRAAQ